MASYRIKQAIKESAIAAGIAAVPGSFVPGIDIVAVGGSWLYMMNQIADEYNITFEEDATRFIGTIAAAVGGYWTDSKIFTYTTGAILSIFTFGAGVLLIPISNVILNMYFTWSVGKKMDLIFASESNTKAGDEVAKLIIKMVCNIPDRSEIKEFWNECGLSLDLIKSWFD